MKTVILGNHTYKSLGIAFDVSNALYNPADPEEVVADIHPIEAPGRKALAKLRGGRITAKALLDYPWSSANDINLYPEEGEILAAYGGPFVEVRSLSDLSLKARYEVEGVNVLSAAYDSSGNIILAGDGGVYALKEGRTTRLLNARMPLGLDCQRSPFARSCALSDHSLHRVVVFKEWGEPVGSTPFPYPGGVRFTPDERLIISSGKIPEHVQLTVVLGAVHTTAKSGWAGYLHDYATLPSNRADSADYGRYLFQWALGVFEAEAPLPKHKPYVVRLGSGANWYLRQEGYEAPTPLPVLGECHIYYAGPGELGAEVLRANYVFYGLHEEEAWRPVERLKNGEAIRAPGIYRLAARGLVEDAYAVCAPGPCASP